MKSSLQQSIIGVSSLRPLRLRGESSRLARRGFSFIEILFAVLILGIGFIMVAGIFPVAIGQTQANGSETAAAAVGREAVNYLSSLPGLSDPNVMLPSGIVQRFDDTKFPGTSDAAITGSDSLWDMVKNNLVLPEDPRYAWVPLYFRGQDANGTPDPFARVIVIVVKVRNHDAYTTSTNGDLSIVPAGASNASPQATLMARPVTVQLQGYTDATPDQITFVATPDVGTGAEGANNAVASGAYVVIQSDPGNSSGSATGWVLRVGLPLAPGSSTWTLQPGGDMKGSTFYKPSHTAQLPAFIIGQGADPDNPATFSGGAQDVMAYSSFIQLH